MFEPEFDAQATNIWNAFLAKNYELLKKEVEHAKNNVTMTRDYMAENGYELTPSQLVEFTEWLDQSLKKFEESN